MCCTATDVCLEHVPAKSSIYIWGMAAFECCVRHVILTALLALPCRGHGWVVVMPLAFWWLAMLSAKSSL